MTISNELLDELLKGCKRPEDLLGYAGLMKELKVRLMERMLGAELTAHLGYDAGAEPPAEQTNRRNGVATKRVKSSDGEVPLSVPRDRESSFEPELVKKGQTRIDGGQARRFPDSGASAPRRVEIHKGTSIFDRLHCSWPVRRP
ncbi:transposase [Paracoccus sp. EF6]|uniref:Mutator family transposase n=1 Tax=Paracoccus benzoatiresistens TaxID=2997341 RepID=A0ABT4J5B5_9RHOB|nr:transposase [Paracoccus sp. EF6]MCZ0961835.1 transposase [Paracoccus sp. EF6]